jgi:class 3 adenylate cyclase
MLLNIRVFERDTGALSHELIFRTHRELPTLRRQTRAPENIGDGALIVFDAVQSDRGVEALLDLKLQVDRYFEARAWECRAIIKAHVGAVIAGPYGPPEDRRFDVIGKTVNAAAMLDTAGVALSVEAFRKLSPATRRRFKKHTWPVTYIRVEDPHRFRRR